MSEDKKPVEQVLAEGMIDDAVIVHGDGIDKRIKPPVLAPIREGQGDAYPRKIHYGPKGKQPWDDMLAFGWGPHFAGGCILRYLRRDKAVEHSRESAVWYYNRLYDGAYGKLPGPSTVGEWSAVLYRIELSLTDEEMRIVRGLV